MAARYVEITLEEMEKFLKRAFRVLRAKQGSQRGEIHYDLKLGSFVGIRVWTSIRPGSGMGADVGSDAIRVQFISLKDQGPLEKGKAPIVKRTQGWRDGLKDRIEDLIEKYEDNEEFWENWAGTRTRKGDPEKVIEQEKKEEQQERKEEKPSTPSSKFQGYQYDKCRKLTGDITDKQIKFLRFLLRSVSHNDWYQLGFNEVTDFSNVPDKEQMQSLSKAQGCILIEVLTSAGYAERYASEDFEAGSGFEADA